MKQIQVSDEAAQIIAGLRNEPHRIPANVTGALDYIVVNYNESDTEGDKGFNAAALSIHNYYYLLTQLAKTND